MAPNLNEASNNNNTGTTQDDCIVLYFTKGGRHQESEILEVPLEQLTLGTVAAESPPAAAKQYKIFERYNIAPLRFTMQLLGGKLSIDNQICNLFLSMLMISDQFPDNPV